MPNVYRLRRLVTVCILAVIIIGALSVNIHVPATPEANTNNTRSSSNAMLAKEALNQLSVKGRAPKTGYSRAQFGDGWTVVKGCDTRNIILHRDMTDVQVDQKCEVISGILNDPYTGKIINFKRGSNTSADVQIDHVVAISDAWQKGAQQLSKDQRIALANDPLELLAVDGPANQQKSDGDAATWLPPYKPFRCQYVARQIAVKQKYSLWVTQAEKDAILNILSTCPDQALPSK
ncbi:HNH endonuclease [Patescibacteria group bacterium]|nr:MAG: HNH endonuclease [Patescibacteria group bacterium]